MTHGVIDAVRTPGDSQSKRRPDRRSHPMLLVGLAVIVIGALAVIAGQLVALRDASANVARLAAERTEQQKRLDAMERQAQTLQRLNAESERSIEKIERTLGARRAGSLHAMPPAVHASAGTEPDAAALSLRLRSLAAASARTRAQATELAGLARRVLNLRRLANIARSRMIASIPSLNPVNGGVNAAFGWRTDPWPEFHKGLDLAADYGTVVRAAADGVVASAGWEGGFGIKVDVDHQNGYHTWYCHLARADVSPGQHVVRGEPIAAVGTTGESTGPHLHYQVMHDGVAIDPMPFLTGVPANVMATLPRNSSVQ